MPASQAKVQIEMFAEVYNNHEFITEADLKESETKLEAKIDKLDAKLDTKIDRLEIKLVSEISSIKSDVTILKSEINSIKWILGLIVASNIALISKAFFHF